jgi:two-component system phosphate regulon response regulator PhoB
MSATILVCDNEETLRTLVRASLDGLDCDIVEARDGEEALELARRIKPDLILLDMMMPGRNGLEVLAILRGDPSFGSTPVIMLTASAQQSDRSAAFEQGATRFLSKPFSPVVLSALVEETLLLIRRQTASAQ